MKDYTIAKNKRALQKEIYRYFIEQGNNKIVGLSGPNPLDYVSYLKSCGFEGIRIYENSVKVLKKIASHLPKLPKNVEFKYADIYKDRIKKNTVYDLDFCGTMLGAEKYVKKFKENFIITVSLRRCSFKDTIDLFIKYREEEKWIVIQSEDPTKTVVQTNKGTYMFIKYRDTANMCTVYKLREK